jgi:hypothetical protein
VELADEPRLADPGRPQQRELVGDVLGDGVVEGPQELGELVLPADEGESRRRRMNSAPATRSVRRYAVSGRDLPLAATGRTGSATTASRTSRYVDSPSSVSPGAAACSSRAATLTASPVASASGSPATTSPVLTPIRLSIRTPQSR